MQTLEQIMQNNSTTESFDINIYFERNQRIRKENYEKKLREEKKEMYKKLTMIAADMKKAGYEIKDIEAITELPKKVIEHIR